jgi:hypothetical protein
MEMHPCEDEGTFENEIENGKNTDIFLSLEIFITNKFDRIRK